MYLHGRNALTILEVHDKNEDLKHKEEASAHEPRVVTEKRGRPLRQRPEPVPPWVLH